MRIILHIGFHKAGSTYIQNFFRANYLRFKKQGVLFPRSGFEHGLRKFSTAGHNILSADRDDERLTRFMSEVLSAEQPVLVLSAENLSLEAEKSAETLAGFLHGHAVTVVAYLRRQDKTMASMYKEQVTGGWGKFEGSLLEFFDSDLFSHELLDYSHVLDAYANHFGKENIVVRPFESAQWKDGSLARDFVHVCSLPWVKGLRQPKLVKGNPSYPDAMVQLIRLLNRVELPEQFYREFIFRVSKDVRSGDLGMGPDHLDPQKTGKSFWTALGEGNRRIASAYLPDNQPLFIEPDFVPISIDPVSELSPFSSYLFGCFVESLTDWIASIDKTRVSQHSANQGHLSVLEDRYAKLMPVLIDLKDWAGTSRNLLSDVDEFIKDLHGESTNLSNHLEQMDNRLDEAIANIRKGFESKLEDIGGQLERIGFKQKAAISDLDTRLHLSKVTQATQHKALEASVQAIRTGFANDFERFSQQIQQLQKELQRTVRDDVPLLLAAAVERHKNEIIQQEREQHWLRWKNDRSERLKGVRGRLLLRRESRFLRRCQNFDLAHFIKQDISPVSQGQDIIRYFAATGILEGFSPEQGFNTIEYVCNHHASLKYGENPYIHYLKHNK